MGSEVNRYGEGALQSCSPGLVGNLVISEDINIILHGMDGEGFKNSQLTSITIPGTIETLPYQMCQNAAKLERVIVSEGTTLIKSSAFSHCASLKEIVLPDMLLTIEEHAFSKCASLEQINLPDSVKTIGQYAFWGVRDAHQRRLRRHYGDTEQPV